MVKQRTLQPWCHQQPQRVVASVSAWTRECESDVTRTRQTRKGMQMRVGREGAQQRCRQPRPVGCHRAIAQRRKAQGTTAGSRGLAAHRRRTAEHSRETGDEERTQEEVVVEQAAALPAIAALRYTRACPSHPPVAVSVGTCGTVAVVWLTAACRRCRRRMTATPVRWLPRTGRSRSAGR